MACAFDDTYARNISWPQAISSDTKNIGVSASQDDPISPMTFFSPSNWQIEIIKQHE